MMTTAAAAAAAPSIRFRAAASRSTSPGQVTRTLKPPRSSTPRPPASLVKDDGVLPPSQILTLKNSNSAPRGKMGEHYMGHERWLPVAPDMKRPQSKYSATSLAYLGDSIYELYVRRHFLFPPLSINEYNGRVMKLVRCEAQDLLLKKLLNEEYLTEEERDVLRWGNNISTGRTRTKKRAGVAVYNRASSLETLIGYLYLTDVKRLEEVMQKMGFSTGASSDLIAEELHTNSRKQPVEPQIIDNI